MPNQIYYQKCSTPIGDCHLFATDKGLIYVGLPGSFKISQAYIKKHYGEKKTDSGNRHTKTASSQLNKYFSRRLTKFDVRLDPHLTEFSKAALREVSRIPYGKTHSYGEIARRLGKPGAARAVGRANAGNPLPIIIPCHRVVASSGLGGYSGGLKLKEKLLALESGQ